jgi:5-methylcytosine-specific restriction enzyme A
MSISQRTRQAVYARCGGMCEIRGPRCLGRTTEIDHIIPRGMGGRHGEAKKRNDDISNLRGVCLACHRERHDGGKVYV